MPLQPNVVERRLISSGKLPWLLPDLFLSMVQSQAVIAAIQLGVFDQFETEPVTVDELAERTGAHPRGMEILVRALEGLGYLAEDENGYRLTKPARRSLPDQDSEAVRAMGTWFAEYMRECASAAEAVREAPEDGLVGWEFVKEGEVGRGYQASMRWLASDLVEPVVDTVSLPDGASQMIDLGGSHGLYTVRFCQEHPGMEGLIVDWPIGLAEAEKTLEDRPEMADRIELLERDFEQEDIPGGNDLAFLGNIVHGIDPDGNKELFEKLAEATTDEGTVAILDQIPAESGGLRDRLDPTNTAFTRGVSALVGFNLFLFSGGRTYQFARVRDWLHEAGFAEVSHHGIRQSPGMSVVVAQKPR